MTSDGPAWDSDNAQAIVGGTVVIGITYVTEEGERLEQMFGRIVSVQASGVEISLQGHAAGRTFTLPPDIGSFLPAPAGEYRLRSTGEVVSDPDYTAAWTVSQPAD